MLELARGLEVRGSFVVEDSRRLGLEKSKLNPRVLEDELGVERDVFGERFRVEGCLVRELRDELDLLERGELRGIVGVMLRNEGVGEDRRTDGARALGAEDRLGADRTVGLFAGAALAGELGLFFWARAPGATRLMARKIIQKARQDVFFIVSLPWLIADGSDAALIDLQDADHGGTMEPPEKVGDVRFHHVCVHPRLR